MEKKTASNEWEQTFDALPDLIMILDRDYRIVKANRAMAKKLGCAQKDLLGHDCYKIVHGTKAPPQRCPHTQLVSDGLAHITEAIEPILGGEYKITVSPLLDDKGIAWGCVHVARDITDIKRSQEEIKKAHDKLDQRVRERTQSLKRAKDRVVRQARQLEKSRAELRERIRFEEFLATLSTKFADLPAERVGEEVTQGLKLLVEYLNIDRSTSSGFSGDPSQLKMLYSYARQGFEPDALNWQRDPRFFWMKSVNCRLSYRPSCFGFWRTVSLNG